MNDADDPSKKIPLSDQIQVFNEPVPTEPLPEGTAEYLEEFFSSLAFEPYPSFDLTDPIEAGKAAEHAQMTLDNLNLKMKQVKALGQMLQSRSEEKKA